MTSNEFTASIEAVESNIEFDFIFNKGVADEERNITFIHLDRIDGDFIECQKLIIFRKYKFIGMDYLYDGPDLFTIDGLDSNGNLVDESTINIGPIWTIQNNTSNFYKEDKSSLETIKNSIGDIIWNSTGYIDFILEDNLFNTTYEWSNGQTGYKPKMEDGFYGVIVCDAEGNEKKYSRIKFPEYIETIETLNQLKANKKSIKKRIKDEKIHISISRRHLHTGTYHITIKDLNSTLHEETLYIESDFIPKQPKPTNNTFF